MTLSLQTFKFGKREFVVLPKRDFERLAAQARWEQAEDEYWTNAALKAEAYARAKGEKPIPLEEIERELNARKRRKGGSGRRKSKGGQ
jgi:hypothetical protein